MELTPAEFRCAADDVDLTEDVRAELEERIPASMARPEQFRVIVTCPGPPGGESHRLGFTGTVRYPR